MANDESKPITGGNEGQEQTPPAAEKFSIRNLFDKLGEKDLMKKLTAKIFAKEQAPTPDLNTSEGIEAALTTWEKIARHFSGDALEKMSIRLHGEYPKQAVAEMAKEAAAMADKDAEAAAKHTAQAGETLKKATARIDAATPDISKEQGLLTAKVQLSREELLAKLKGLELFANPVIAEAGEATLQDAAGDEAKVETAPAKKKRTTKEKKNKKAAAPVIDGAPAPDTAAVFTPDAQPKPKIETTTSADDAAKEAMRLKALESHKLYRKLDKEIDSVWDIIVSGNPTAALESIANLRTKIKDQEDLLSVATNTKKRTPNLLLVSKLEMYMEDIAQMEDGMDRLLKKTAKPGEWILFGDKQYSLDKDGKMFVKEYEADSATAVLVDETSLAHFKQINAQYLAKKGAAQEAATPGAAPAQGETGSAKEGTPDAGDRRQAERLTERLERTMQKVADMTTRAENLIASGITVNDSLDKRIMLDEIRGALEILNSYPDLQKTNGVAFAMIPGIKNLEERLVASIAEDRNKKEEKERKDNNVREVMQVLDSKIISLRNQLTKITDETALTKLEDQYADFVRKLNAELKHRGMTTNDGIQHELKEMEAAFDRKAGEFTTAKKVESPDVAPATPPETPKASESVEVASSLAAEAPIEPDTASATSTAKEPPATPDRRRIRAKDLRKREQGTEDDDDDGKPRRGGNSKRSRRGEDARVQRAAARKPADLSKTTFTI